MSQVYPEQFMSETPPPRIIGVETEYDVQASLDTSSWVYTRNAIESTGLKAIGSYASNGARIYRDAYGQLEYATPECLGPSIAAAADMAGKLIIAEMVSNSGMDHRGVYRITGSSLDGVTPVSSGHHENYLIPSHIIGYREFQPILESFFASRFWLGAGGLNRGGYIFCQKSSGIGAPIMLNSGNRMGHGSKPFALVHMSGGSLSSDINTDPGWARLETRYSDANMSPFAKFMALATTSLVLRVIENRCLLNQDLLNTIALAKSVRAFHIFSTDTTMSRVVNSEDGQKLSALDIQIYLQQLAAELAEKIELPSDEQVAVKLWGLILDRLMYLDLGNRHYAGLEKFLDFAAKHNFLLHSVGPENINSLNSMAFFKDKSWDRIEPIGGGDIWWGYQPMPDKVVSEKQILHLSSNPPHGTRAQLRSRYILKRQNVSKVQWNLAVVNGKNIVLNPYNSE